MNIKKLIPKMRSKQYITYEAWLGLREMFKLIEFEGVEVY